MATPRDELKRVVREQGDLYDAMVRSIYGERVTLAITAATLGGFGIGLLFSDRWGARYTGALCYAMAGMMQLYAVMSPKTQESRAMPESRPEARAAA